MVDVGAMLGYHIDKYIYKINQNYEMGKLFRFIKQGDQHTGRLLHYYSSSSEQEWCGWHNDHSALTSLTTPLYMTEKGELLEDFVDKEAGLLAKNRFAEI